MKPKLKVWVTFGDLKFGDGRARLLEAIDDAEQRGSLNGIVAALLREVVQHAPVQWLIDGGQGLAGLFG